MISYFSLNTAPFIELPLLSSCSLRHSTSKVLSLGAASGYVCTFVNFVACVLVFVCYFFWISSLILDNSCKLCHLVSVSFISNTFFFTGSYTSCTAVSEGEGGGSLAGLPAFVEMGPIGHSPTKANPIKQKKCVGESCANLFAPSTVSDTLCPSCKTPPTGFTPVGGKKSVEKRGSDNLSPIMQPESKASKNDESMDESEGIPLNNQTSISGLNSQAISSYMAAAAKDLANSEQKDKELANLRAVNIQLVKEITQVKLALADSAVKIYILEKAASEAQIKTQDVNNGAPPSVTTARPGKKVSYANVAKISKKPVFTLMAKVAQPGGSVSVKQVHSLIDFENDGPQCRAFVLTKTKSR